MRDNIGGYDQPGGLFPQFVKARHRRSGRTKKSWMCSLCVASALFVEADHVPGEPMTLAALTAEEKEVIRRSLEATFQFFDVEFHTRLGVGPEAMRDLLSHWPHLDDSPDDSNARLAIKNALNDLLHGVGISDRKARELTGANRAEMLRIYRKWAQNRGWSSTGLR